MHYIDYAKNPAAGQAFLNSWANQLASWDVDYAKLDGVGDWDIPDVQHWSQALNQAGRPIHFELSNSLEIGGSNTGLTADERRTAMTLWAVTASPITLGTDLTALTADDLSLLTNDEVLAVDQRGNAARPVDQLTQLQFPTPTAPWT